MHRECAHNFSTMNHKVMQFLQNSKKLLTQNKHSLNIVLIYSFVRFHHRCWHSVDSHVLATGSWWRICSLHTVWSVGNVRWCLGNSNQWFVLVHRVYNNAHVILVLTKYIQVSAWTGSVLCRWWTPTDGELQCSSMSMINCIIITDCPPYASFHPRWLGISGFCHSYLHVTSASSLPVFRARLKTCLFSLFFHNCKVETTSSLMHCNATSFGLQAKSCKMKLCSHICWTMRIYHKLLNILKVLFV